MHNMSGGKVLWKNEREEKRCFQVELFFWFVKLIDVLDSYGNKTDNWQIY